MDIFRFSIKFLVVVSYLLSGKHNHYCHTRTSLIWTALLAFDNGTSYLDFVISENHKEFLTFRVHFLNFVNNVSNEKI